MPVMDDGIATKDVPWLFKGFAKRVEKMALLSDDAWERIRVEFSISNIHLALREAGKVQPNPAPAYWQPVVEACERIIEGLRGQGDLDTADDDARAAYAAAARSVDAYAAASAAANAARAAVHAADAYDDAACVATSGYAADRATWKEIAESLFAEIGKEISKL
jgi:hypothetical protein